MPCYIILETDLINSINKGFTQKFAFISVLQVLATFAEKKGKNLGCIIWSKSSHMSSFTLIKSRSLQQGQR